MSEDITESNITHQERTVQLITLCEELFGNSRNSKKDPNLGDKQVMIRDWINGSQIPGYAQDTGNEEILYALDQSYRVYDILRFYIEHPETQVPTKVVRVRTDFDLALLRFSRFYRHKVGNGKALFIYDEPIYEHVMTIHPLRRNLHINIPDSDIYYASDPYSTGKGSYTFTCSNFFISENIGKDYEHSDKIEVHSDTVALIKTNNTEEKKWERGGSIGSLPNHRGNVSIFCRLLVGQKGREISYATIIASAFSAELDMYRLRMELLSGYRALELDSIMRRLNIIISADSIEGVSAEDLKWCRLILKE